MQPEAAMIADQINNAIKFAFVQAGFKVKQVGLQFRSDGKILTAMGWHADSTPFAYASKPFHDDPMQFAQAAVTGLIAAHVGSTPQTPALVAPQGSTAGMSTGPVTDLAGRIRSIRDRHAAKMAGIEKTHDQRLGSIGARGDAALDKLDQALKSQADQEEAEVRALEDEVNQLTNGAP